jgi:hypothetical protein
VEGDLDVGVKVFELVVFSGMSQRCEKEDVVTEDVQTPGELNP